MEIQKQMEELKLKEESEKQAELKFSSDVTELDNALFWINLSA